MVSKLRENFFIYFTLFLVMFLLLFFPKVVKAEMAQLGERLKI